MKRKELNKAFMMIHIKNNNLGLHGLYSMVCEGIIYSPNMPRVINGLYSDV